MAKSVSISTDPYAFDTTITKAFQSGNINFLLGSGASLPAISTAGNIEQELNALIETKPKDFEKKKFEFLRDIQASTDNLIERSENAKEKETLANYHRFLNVLSRILEERKTDLLPKQVTLFTTNYDLFIERASEDILTMRLNDGFNRGPTLTGHYPFEPEHFFDITYKTGNLFKYTFPIPVVNLIKLHGSLSWYVQDGELIHRVEKVDIPDVGSEGFEKNLPVFLDQFSLVLPTRKKFAQTLMERIYYDLLRTFANALENENTVLVSFGFSFDDEHILDIVTKALKNPTLLLVIIAHSEKSVDSYKEKFKKHNNVVIFHTEEDEKIDFKRLNGLLSNVIPKSAYANE